MQCKEWGDANSELFKEPHDEAVHKNSYKSRLCELISASLAHLPADKVPNFPKGSHAVIQLRHHQREFMRHTWINSQGYIHIIGCRLTHKLNTVIQQEFIATSLYQHGGKPRKIGI